MTNFDKIIGDTPQSMRREEYLRQVRDSLTLEPAKKEFVAATYLAWQIIVDMRRMVDSANVELREELQFQDNFRVTQVLGALHVALGALTKEFVLDSPRPAETLVYLMERFSVYDGLVDSVYETLRESRKP